MGKKIQCIGRYVMESQTLGKGNFARVELATHGVTGCKVAIKIIDTRKLKEEYMRQNLHREARILGQLRHPNIIRLYETLKAATLYCLVTEYAAGGELFSFIKLHPDSRLPEDRARPFIRQLISAIHYLHERGVAHRDLKMENIMIDDKRKNIKIVDFGLSNTFSKDDLMKTHCGSPEYAAPELFNPSEKYGPEIDIWSLGIIIYVMMVGKLPFTTPCSDQFRRQKLLQQIEKGLVQQHHKEMGHLSQDCKELMHKLIEPSPSLRLPLMDIEIHPWITLEAKYPFHPFQALPKNKPMKHQTLDELSELLSMERVELEKAVHENRCDELSAMFNMIMDKKRVEKGVFDVDHTSKPERKHEKSAVKSKSSKSSLPKPVSKDALKNSSGGVLNPTQQITIEAPSSEGEPKQSTNFDLLAICSAPTWLGPGRRRSRRKSRWQVSYNAEQHDNSNHRERTRSQSPDRIRTKGAMSPLQSPNQLSVSNIPIPPGFQEKTRRNSRNSSQRRSQSCGPHTKRTSFNLKHKSIDEPDSGHSNPTPRQSPIPRPAKLTIQECYKPVSVKTITVEPHSPNGPLTTVEVHFANSSNPCSTTNIETSKISCSQIPLLQEDQADSTTELGSQLITKDEKCSLKVLNNIIVKPKKKLLTNNFLLPVDSRLTGAIPKQKGNSNSQPKLGPKYSSGSSESFVETMQPNNYANLSDDEKLEKCKHNNSTNLPRTDSEKRIEQGITDLKLTDAEESEEKIDSRSCLLAEASGTSHLHLTVPGSFLDSRTPSNDSHTPDDSVFSELQEHDDDDDNEPIIMHTAKENVACKNPHQNVLRHSGSLQSQKRTNSSSLKTPITPTKQFLRSPLARIESFHSDDFEMLTSEIDNPGKTDSPTLSQSSDASVNCMKTPIPCFMYNRKNIKSRGPKCKCQPNSKVTKNTKEDVQIRVDKPESVPGDNLPKEENEMISDRVIEDTLERITHGGSSKIHPITKDEQEGEISLHLTRSKIPRATGKTGYQVLSSLCSEVTNKPVKSKHMQKALKNTLNFEPPHDQKKAVVKASPWKRGFAHFLKKKRTKRYPTNNNNESANSCHLATTNNGHATSPVSKSAPICLEETLREPESQASLSPASAVHTDGLEYQRSPAICHSPAPLTKVFDFPTIHESPKRVSCLISWKRCRECTFTDQSSDEESDYNFQLEEKVNTATKPPLTINNIQDLRFTSTTCPYANT